MLPKHTVRASSSHSGRRWASCACRRTRACMRANESLRGCARTRAQSQPVGSHRSRTFARHGRSDRNHSNALSSPLPHLRRDCVRTGLSPATSAPGLGSHLATSAPGLGCASHICAGTGLRQPHLCRDWAHPSHTCARTGLTPCHICAGTGLRQPVEWDCEGSGCTRVPASHGQREHRGCQQGAHMNARMEGCIRSRLS